MGDSLRISLKECRKTIHNHEVLKNINLELETGHVYGLQGCNGSGKTMLLRLICGLIYPTEGQVQSNGKILGKDIDFLESVGLLLETPQFLNNYTGFENLKLLADVNGKVSGNEIKFWLKAVGLDADYRKKYKKYSLGMKQRLGIAAAFMENPSVILLDEPTNALDEAGIEVVRSLIMEKLQEGTLIVVASHARDFLNSVCDQIFTLSEGEVIKWEKFESEQVENG